MSLRAVDMLSWECSTMRRWSLKRLRLRTRTVARSSAHALLSTWRPRNGTWSRRLPATYDPEIKLVSYKVTQKLYAGQVTVIVGATVNGRKTEARWSFNVGSKEAKEANQAKEPS